MKLTILSVLFYAALVVANIWFAITMEADCTKHIFSKVLNVLFALYFAYNLYKELKGIKRK